VAYLMACRLPRIGVRVCVLDDGLHVALAADVVPLDDGVAVGVLAVGLGMFTSCSWFFNVC